MSPEQNLKAAPKTVTLIIHGTFAAGETWWRLGEGENRTFADRLEVALAKRGLQGSVWKPLLDCGFGYDAFSWSGENRHKARQTGSRKLIASLKLMADQCEAEGRGRLRVNLVAHSHGGNVVLEALRRFPDKIEIGRVILLGTPLLAVKPSLRLLRLVVAYVMLTIILLFGSYLLIQGVISALQLAGLTTPTAPTAGAEFSDKWIAPAIPLIIIFYGWLFYLLAEVGDFVWRVAVAPFSMMTGRWAGQVYGPRAATARKILRNHPAVLFTSHFDEAALLLSVCSAPRQLYVEFVSARLSPVRLFLERLLFRPIAVGLILRCVEVVLERAALGFAKTKLLFFDYEMADLDKGREYPKSVVTRRDVTEELRPSIQKKRLSLALATAQPVELKEAAPGEDRHVASLKNALETAGRDLMSQVRLRHSLYYDNDVITELIAEELTAK